MKRLIMATVLGFLAASSTQAQTVKPCEGFTASAENIPEPWENSTAVFANGAVRVVVLDTVEPAAAAFHLMVLSPPFDGAGLRQCRLVSMGGAGFAGLHLDGLESKYIPGEGLMITLSAQLYDPENIDPEAAKLMVKINQATGVIKAHLE